MLFLVATPIGNLGDISYRAVEILKIVDLILCEDTRHAQILLRNYDITTPLASFHKFNEAGREESIIADLLQGKKIAMISDAGTPGIADPGERLVARCVAEGVALVPIPGASAAITALSVSGFPTLPYQHIGFIPKKGQERALALHKLMEYEGCSICFESPHRIEQLIQDIQAISPQRHLVLARELTKKFEEFIRGTAEELLEHFKNFPVKGEMVLMVAPNLEEKVMTFSNPKEHMQYLMDTYGLSKKEAIKMTAQLSGRARRDVYKLTVTDETQG